MHREAVLWMLRDFPHRQLVSFLVHGVTLHDDLPLQTSIAANLLSFYEVRGGPDAVADEMNGLKERGWYLSSAGLVTTADTATVATTAAGTATAPARAATTSSVSTVRLLTSPARINPRGAVPRKDLGPPRGVAELGYPRRETFTIDTGEPVTSVNVATSAEHSTATGDDFWARKEVKPRPCDLMFNLLVLRAMGNLMRAACGVAPATLLILFDYKYFFHALAYMAGDVWKTGCAVPAREAVLAGEHLALRCPGCPTPLQHGCCHSLVLAAAVAQRCSISLETDAGPPADPVTAPPRVAYRIGVAGAPGEAWEKGVRGPEPLPAVPSSRAAACRGTRVAAPRTSSNACDTS
jgi:hypothetical protein